MSDTLDAAWAEAEAALPNGYEHRDHPLWRFGSWRMRVVGPWNIEHSGHRPTWQAIAEPYNATGNGLDSEVEALGATPAAALIALAEKLREARS